MDSEGRQLHPLEVQVLRGVTAGEKLTPEEMVSRLGMNLGQCNQAVSWLAGRGFIEEVCRTPKTLYEITGFGREQRELGTVEERIVKMLASTGGKTFSEIAETLQVQGKDVGSAFGQLSKEGLLQMDRERRITLLSEKPSARMSLLRTLLDRGVENGNLDGDILTEEEVATLGGVSKKRGVSGMCFKISEREEVSYSLSPEGVSVREYLEREGITGDELGGVTPEMLSSGSWKGARFREYNINTPASRVLLGRGNPYGEYLEAVKDKLCFLGFQEFDGPLVETEFWNGDALFMPQFHSARDIHDVYYLDNPSHAREIEQPWLDSVASVHEDGGETGSRGWGYSFDREFTRRLILRSQGTVLSAKQLPKAKIPGKYFGVVRCFRYDQVDATHGADFYQTEGIVLGEEVNLKTLLGLLKMFAEELAGAEEVRYVPGYFPFTEPSVEVHIKHPTLGWFELGGSGIFRSEVTEPLGIDVPVLAWGLGIDRMALLHLGLSDLRELFSPNIDTVRLRRGM